MAATKSAVQAKRVFAIFQGGGAKGISHLGALSALEDAPIQLSGVAGTSAGAIIAALVSAGYSSSEMFDCESGKTILASVDRNFGKPGATFAAARGPKDLFGRGGWIALMAARRFSAQGIDILYLYGCALGLSAWFGWGGGYWWAILIFGLLVTCAGLVIWRALNGLATLNGFVRGLQQLLGDRISPGSVEPITFAGMKDAGCLPLRIVASNVRARSVKVFSAETTPDVPVAEAVAASACLPLIFAPRILAPDSFYDGGLMSNLPAWVFDEERGLDRDASTVTIEIVDQSVRAIGPVTGLAALVGAIQTGIFGTSALEKRAVPNLFSVGLRPKVGLLDFDMSVATAKNEILSAKDECRLRLVYRLVTLPSIMENLCAQISAGALLLINTARESAGLKPFRKGPRAAIALPVPGTYRTLQLAHTHGYDNSTDRGLILPVESSFAGRSWQSGESYYFDDSIAEWKTLLNRPEDRGLRKLVSPSMVWAVTIAFQSPDFGDGNCKLVLALDGDRQLGLDTRTRNELLKALNSTIQSMLMAAVPQEIFQDGY